MEKSKRAPLEHAYLELETRLRGLLVRARAGDWRDLESDWADLMTAIEARRAFEEGVLFPAFAARDPGRRAMVKRLVEEHAAMQQLLVEVRHQIRRRVLREVSVEVLSELLCEHAAIESAHIDPWIALDPRKWALTVMPGPDDP